ncbi:MAG: SCO family protein [Candidatus Thioglobus sp.]|nr:SCO family protein [Candidatus Thioglobus sp.]
MNKSTLLSSLFLIVLIGVAAFFYFGGKPSIGELKNSVAPAASLYPQAKSVSDKLNFINDRSDAVHLSDLTQGKWALLYFGYTSCPDICPVDLSKINLTYQMMDNKDSLQVVFISVDPSRDIGRLNKFASAFNPSFLGLTAYQDELMTISRSLGVYHEVVESQKLAQEDHSSHGESGEHDHEDNDMDSDTDSHEDHDMDSIDNHTSTKTVHYEIDHTSSYLLFNPDLKLTALLTSPHEPAPMAKAIDEIIEALR